ncbi:TPA: inorganic phosphate transporter, partial [Serratia liquefaciens]|nr:inorganic phosphate transporter [Serratia liquefaciens]
MSDNSAVQAGAPSASSLPKIYQKNSRLTVLFFILLLVLGIAFAGVNLFNDVSDAGAVYTSYVPFLLLGMALLIALGFEFVNGFHDTANAVATVIYTHSLSPMV